MYPRKRQLQVTVLAGALCTPVWLNAAEIIYQSVGFIDGSATKVASFNVTAAGWYDMRLVDFEYGEEFQELSFTVADDSQTFSTVSSKGEKKVRFDAPGQYYASVTGKAGDTFDLGMYGISIEYSNQALIEPLPSSVPLPAAIWFFGSSVASLIAVLWRRKYRGS